MYIYMYKQYIYIYIFVCICIYPLQCEVGGLDGAWPLAGLCKDTLRVPDK